VAAGKKGWAEATEGAAAAEGVVKVTVEEVPEVDEAAPGMALADLGKVHAVETEEERGNPACCMK